MLSSTVLYCTVSVLDNAVTVVCYTMYVQLPSVLTVRHDTACVCVCVCVCVCEALHCTLLCCTVLFYTALYCTCTVLIELCRNSLCVQMSMSSSALYRP